LREGVGEVAVLGGGGEGADGWYRLAKRHVFCQVRPYR